MLSAQELIGSREKPELELPSFGTKDFEPNGSPEQLHQIQQSISEINKLISYKKVKMIGSLSQAIWRPELNLAEVVHQTGPQWTTMGHLINQKLYIYPEEALYLLEIGSIEILYNGVSLSIQRAYFVLLKKQSDITIEKYRVYSHLSASGYKVLRHSPKNTITKYEKQLEVHKLKIKIKNDSSNILSNKRPLKLKEKNLKIVKRNKVEINFPVVYTENDNFKEVFRKIQIFQPYFESTDGNLNFDYDIYSESPGKNSFKKSCLQLPNYRVIVHKNDDSMPDLKEIYQISRKYKDEVPVVHAIVFPDHIAFYEINSVILPETFD